MRDGFKFISNYKDFIVEDGKQKNNSNDDGSDADDDEITHALLIYSSCSVKFGFFLPKQNRMCVCEWNRNGPACKHFMEMKVLLLSLILVFMW